MKDVSYFFTETTTTYVDYEVTDEQYEELMDGGDPENIIEDFMDEAFDGLERGVYSSGIEYEMLDEDDKIFY